MTEWNQKLKAFQILSNEQLHAQLLSTGANYRSALVNGIALLAESFRRKDYARRAFPSLGKYAFEVFGVPSVSTAYRYAEIAKLCDEFPQVLDALERGEMTLDSAAMVRSAFREQARKRQSESERLTTKKTDFDEDTDPNSKAKADPLTREQKTEIIDQIKNHSLNDARKIVIEEIASRTGEVLPEQRTAAQIRACGGEWSEVRFFLNRDEVELLERLKSVLSHKVQEADLNAVLLRLISDGLDKYDPKEIEARAQARREKAKDTAGKKSSQPEKISKNVQASSTTKRQAVLRHGLNCLYTDPQTGRICGSELFIDLDHIVPRSRGGEDHLDNLQPFCSTHNRLVKGNRCTRAKDQHTDKPLKSAHKKKVITIPATSPKAFTPTSRG